MGEWVSRASAAVNERQRACEFHHGRRRYRRPSVHLTNAGVHVYTVSTVYNTKHPAAQLCTCCSDCQSLKQTPWGTTQHAHLSATTLHVYQSAAGFIRTVQYILESAVCVGSWPVAAAAAPPSINYRWSSVNCQSPPSITHDLTSLHCQVDVTLSFISTSITY